jgi:hypothetical protein
MNPRSRHFFAAALAAVALLLASPARAEPPGLTPDDATLAALALALATAAPPGDLASARAGEGPRIELVATVRAARLVYEEAPRLRVAYGGPPGRLAWRAERTNLPARIQPRQVYEDVAVRVTLVGPIDEVASLLEDARAAAHGIRVETVAPVEVSR